MFKEEVSEEKQKEEKSMKNYTITVNGNVYDVTVEENVQGAARKAAPDRVIDKGARTGARRAPRAVR